MPIDGVFGGANMQELGGTSGNVTISFDPNEAVTFTSPTLTRSSVLNVATISATSTQIANIRAVYDAIQRWGGGGPGGADVHFGTTPPASPTAGRLWLDENSARLMVFYPQAPPHDGVWIEVGGGGGPAVIINSAEQAAATPTELHNGFTEITGPSTGGGVRWTGAQMGAQCMVRNAIPAGIVISFYPPTGGSPAWTVNGQASFTIGPDVTSTFLCLGGNRIVSINP
jgi:hypothetical protein